MKAEELAQLLHRCEDTVYLESALAHAKATNPIVKDLAGLNASRAWSYQHFLALCVVALVNATPEN